MKYWIYRNLLPPLLTRVLTRGARRREEIGRFRELYGQFAAEGDLCFDIGANLGNRVRCFRAHGCRVVAVEPQSFCLGKLRKEFAGDPQVTIVPAALGAAAGRATIGEEMLHNIETGEALHPTLDVPLNRQAVAILDAGRRAADRGVAVLL
jgi:hypothetical protein